MFITFIEWPVNGFCDVAKNYALVSRSLKSYRFTAAILICQFPSTVEPRFNEPLYNEVLGNTFDVLQPREIKSQ